MIGSVTVSSMSLSSSLNRAVPTTGCSVICNSIRGTTDSLTNCTASSTIKSQIDPSKQSVTQNLFFVFATTYHHPKATKYTMFQKSFLFVVATVAIMLPMENRAESLRSSSSSARSLSYESIAGFEPSSIVTDHVSC